MLKLSKRYFARLINILFLFKYFAWSWKKFLLVSLLCVSRDWSQRLFYLFIFSWKCKTFELTHNSIHQRIIETFSRIDSWFWLENTKKFFTWKTFWNTNFLDIIHRERIINLCYNIFEPNQNQIWYIYKMCQNFNLIQYQWHNVNTITNTRI